MKFELLLNINTDTEVTAADVDESIADILTDYYGVEPENGRLVDSEGNSADSWDRVHQSLDKDGFFYFYENDGDIMPRMVCKDEESGMLTVSEFPVNMTDLEEDIPQKPFGLMVGLRARFSGGSDGINQLRAEKEKYEHDMVLYRLRKNNIEKFAAAAGVDPEKYDPRNDKTFMEKNAAVRYRTANIMLANEAMKDLRLLFEKDFFTNGGTSDDNMMYESAAAKLLVYGENSNYFSGSYADNNVEYEKNLNDIKAQAEKLRKSDPFVRFMREESVGEVFKGLAETEKHEKDRRQSLQYNLMMYFVYAKKKQEEEAERERRIREYNRRLLSMRNNALERLNQSFLPSESEEEAQRRRQMFKNVTPETPDVDAEKLKDSMVSLLACHLTEIELNMPDSVLPDEVDNCEKKVSDEKKELLEDENCISLMDTACWTDDGEFFSGAKRLCNVSRSEESDVKKAMRSHWIETELLLVMDRKGGKNDGNGSTGGGNGIEIESEKLDHKPDVPFASR